MSRERKLERKQFPEAKDILQQARKLATSFPSESQKSASEALMANIEISLGDLSRQQSRSDVAANKNYVKAIQTTTDIQTITEAQLKQLGLAGFGIKKPDISILSEEFLLELKGMQQKNGKNYS